MTSGERTDLAARTLGVVRRCAISVAPVSAAAGLALVLRDDQLPHPFVAFSSLAIAITFWCAGTWPGVLAMVLACVAMSEFFRVVPLCLAWKEAVTQRGSVMARKRLRDLKV